MRNIYFTLIILIYLISCESSICNQFKPVYDLHINGKVQNVYYCMVYGRLIGCIDILADDMKTYHFDSFHQWDFYRKIQKGDSVVKYGYSTRFKFYQKGELLGTMDWQCNPPPLEQSYK